MKRKSSECIWHPVVELFDKHLPEIKRYNTNAFEENIITLDDFSYGKKDISHIGSIVITNLESSILESTVLTLITRAKSIAIITNLGHRKIIYETLFHQSIGEEWINDIAPSQIINYMDYIDERYKKIFKIVKELNVTKTNLRLVKIYESIKKDDYSIFKAKKESIEEILNHKKHNK